MYDACRLRGLVAVVYGPGTAFIRSGREEGAKSEQLVGALYESDNTRFLQPHFLQEHLLFLEILKFRYVGLGLGREYEHFGILIPDGLPDSFHVGIALGC